MLLLASLLGMMAVGSIMLFEPNESKAENDETPKGETEDRENPQQHAQIGDISPDHLSFIDENGVRQTIANEPTTESDLLIGSNASDQISSDAGDDHVMAGGGDDVVDGGNDNDVLHGNGGNDDLLGGDGFDALFGDQGADDLQGGAGRDTLEGNGEDDRLSGGDDDDNLLGGEGNDTLLGDFGDDTLVGSAGRDVLIGGEGQDVLFAGDGDDVLIGLEDGSPEIDFLNGGSGDDTILLGAGDEVSGDAGADSLLLRTDVTESARIWDFEAGEDTLILLYHSEDGVPELEIVSDSENKNLWLVQHQGATIAQVSGSQLTLSDISFVEHN